VRRGARFEHGGLLDRAREIGGILLASLGSLQRADPRVGDVRGRGAMVAIEIVDPATGAPDAALTARVVAYAHAHGVILLSCGTHGNVIRFLPPLAIPDALLREGLSVVADGLAAS
jgi:4-aminobutyrate aminotransferase/(S)-3-amino-2-methylpropionate transaminase